MPAIRSFLQEELGLELHMGKLHVRSITQGVEFLGAFVKPYRTYVSNKTLGRMAKNLRALDTRDKEHLRCSVNSYLGVLSHSASYNIRRQLFLNGKAARFMEFDADLLKGKLKCDF